MENQSRISTLQNFQPTHILKIEGGMPRPCSTDYSFVNQFEDLVGHFLIATVFLLENLLLEKLSQLSTTLVQQLENSKTSYSISLNPTEKTIKELLESVILLEDIEMLTLYYRSTLTPEWWIGALEKRGVSVVIIPVRPEEPILRPPL